MNRRASLEPAYVPCSTYRLQLNQRFTFTQAAAVVSYLHDLGITDCYTSPFLMAHPGSMHGYDVTDHTRFNPEIGSEEQFTEFAERLQQRGMGLVVDVVPNHMCITHPSNLWWWDVLENGPSSDYSRYFDIDWNPPKSELANKVLLPFLPDQFGLVLENQSIRALYDGGGFVLDSLGIHFPLAPRSWTPLLERMLVKAKERLADSDGHVLELESIITAISHLPRREDMDLARVRERQREKEVIAKPPTAVLICTFTFSSSPSFTNPSNQAPASASPRSARSPNVAGGSPHHAVVGILRLPQTDLKRQGEHQLNGFLQSLQQAGLHGIGDEAGEQAFDGAAQGKFQSHGVGCHAGAP